MSAGPARPTDAGQAPADPVTNQPMETEPLQLSTVNPSATAEVSLQSSGVSSNGQLRQPSGPPVVALQSLHISSPSDTAAQPQQGVGPMNMDHAAPANG